MNQIAYRQAGQSATEDEEACGDCHFFDFGRCWHTNAMLGGGGVREECLHRRARRAIPPPPIDL
jgi:hypothetical protein